MTIATGLAVYKIAPLVLALTQHSCHQPPSHHVWL
jgi:hypothetical protein